MANHAAEIHKCKGYRFESVYLSGIRVGDLDNREKVGVDLYKGAFYMSLYP